jgi:hypothetical protein
MKANHNKDYSVVESNNAKQPINNKTTKHTESPVKGFFY